MSVNVQVQALLNGVYTTLPLLASDSVEIERGVPAFSNSWPKANSFTCTINNDSLDYDPSRPASLLYAAGAGRNVPVRVRPNASTRIYAEATRWEPTRSVEHVPGSNKGLAKVALRAENLLGRLQTWTEPLQSPMFRTISGRAASIGHWPLEEDRGATRLSNSLPGGAAGLANGVTFGEDDRPAGAARTVKSATGSGMSGRFKRASTSAGWQVSWAFRFDQLPPTSTYELFFRINITNGYTWYFDINNTSYRMNVQDADGTLLTSQLYTYGAGAEPTTWVTMRMAVEQVGGNVSWNWAWYAQDMNIFYVPTGAFAGQIGAARDWRIPGTSVVANAHWSHVFGVTGLTDDLMSSDNRRVFNGYRLESAISRYNRLLREANLTKFTIGDSAQSMRMGPQQPGTLIDNLKLVRSTEDGDISDERFTVAAVTARVRRDMYHMTPALALTYPGDVADYVKLIGSDGVWNRVTVKNADGGEYTLAKESGLMSIAAPPSGIGEVRKQVDVSVADEDVLPRIAEWHLAKGTLEGPRYSAITVDLVKNAGLISAAGGVREGDLITVTGLEPDLLRLLVVGIEERITSGTWRITYLTEPYDTYMVGVWNDTGFVWGTNLSSLASGVAAGVTALPLTTPSLNGVWTANTIGRQLKIAGEVVTVTGMTAAAGTGPYTQTATVTRAANGVAKALPAGAKVELFDNRKWGL